MSDRRLRPRGSGRRRRRTFDIDVWGVLNSMKHEIAAMLKNGGGAIVNTSSVAGHIGLPQASIDVATKHAVEGMTMPLSHK